jgi:hypothetical protein
MKGEVMKIGRKPGSSAGIIKPNTKAFDEIIKKSHRKRTSFKIIKQHRKPKTNPLSCDSEKHPGDQKETKDKEDATLGSSSV